MWVASTPVNKKRKHPSNELDDLAISPIKKSEVKRRTSLPKVPVGTTIELIRFPRLCGPPTSRPLDDITNVPPLSAIPPRLSRFSSQPKLQKEGLCPPPHAEPVPRSSLVAPRATSSLAPTAGLNSIISTASRNSKRNQSIYPELVVLSDSDDEAQVADTVHSKTRKSVAKKRRKSQQADKVSGPAPDPWQSDVPIPSINEFVRDTRNRTRSTIRLQAERTLRLTAFREDALRRQSLFVERSEYVAFETTRVKDENHEDVPKENDGGAPPRPKITKFTFANVESWKEVKDQPGCYFSRGLPPLSAGVDGEPFPARCGYLKLSVKTKLDIATCPNHIVFAVIKGKGHMKEKTNGAAEKTEMNIGDTFVVPRGSAFTFINLATKNEFVLSYVKHN